MSVSNPWNHHFGSHPFPKQNLNLHLYRDAISSSLLSPVALSLPSYSHPQHRHHRPHPPTMSNMNALSADEMERFQKLSNTYEPEVQVRPLSTLSFPTTSAFTADTPTGTTCLTQGAYSECRVGICQCRPCALCKD
jgi:hypothetical protein